MRELKELYELKLKTKEEFKTKAELMELKLERASQLLEGLSGEKDRWQVTVQVGGWEEKMEEEDGGRMEGRWKEDGGRMEGGWR